MNLPKRKSLSRRRGSISLLLALLVPALAGLLALLAFSARQQADDAAVARAMSAQIQAGLSRYERPLLDQYGLFAFRPEACSSRVFDTYMSGKDSAGLELIAQKPLFEAAELDTQIINYMQLRLPSLWIDRILWQTGLSGQPSGVSDLSHLTGWLSSMSADDSAAARGGLFSGLIDQIEDESADWLSQVYREAAVSQIGIPDDGLPHALSAGLPDFFDPQSVAAAAQHLDQMFSLDTPALYEKMCLSEYVLGCFGRSVNQSWHQGSCQPLRMIDGRLLTGLPAGRQAEAEQILTGIEQPKLAVLVTKTAIGSVRALFHLMCQLLDQEAMAVIRGTAATLSAAIAAASAGSVVIDPEMMTWLVVAGRALQKGWTDTRRLGKGYGVAIWPDESIKTPDLYYEDYLRLFFLIQPRGQLVEHIGQRIAANLPGAFYCGLRVETCWRGRTLALEGRYP